MTPKGAEASNILVGELNSLERPLSAFIRLSEASPLGDLTEVPVATRFLYILLGPAGPDHVNLARYHEIGRAVATIMSDEVFHEVAYKVRMLSIRGVINPLLLDPDPESPKGRKSDSRSGSRTGIITPI